MQFLFSHIFPHPPPVPASWVLVGLDKTGTCLSLATCCLGALLESGDQSLRAVHRKPGVHRT